MNATCPVLLGTPVDPTITTRWKGNTIAFSSTTARLMWETDPSRYSANVGGLSGSAGDAGAPTLVRMDPAAGPAAASGTIVTTSTAGRMVSGAGGASPVVSAPPPIARAPKPVVVAAPAPAAPEEECDECVGGSCRIPGR